MNNEGKSVVVFGGFTHEGIWTSVKALGFDLIRPDLKRASQRKWKRRIQELQELRQDGSLAAVVVYLHSHLFLEASHDWCQAYFFELLAEAKHVKSVVFAFQDNLDGIFAPRPSPTAEPMSLKEVKENYEKADQECSDFWRLRWKSSEDLMVDAQSRAQEMRAFTNKLLTFGIDVAPFSQRSDVTVRLQEFFEDLEQGVFLRLFVPSERYQSDQLRSLLGVLERYLRQVERQDFSIDARKSEKGTTYVFRTQSQSEDVLAQMDAALARFDSFIRLCGDDPASAEVILRQHGIPEGDLSFSVSRYAKDYQRLLLDTRHEFERKMLSLKQRFESDGVEATFPLPSALPKEASLSAFLSDHSPLGDIKVNIGSISVVNAETVRNEIEQVMNGNITYSAYDEELLRVFAQHAERLEALQARSDLLQLKDPSTPEATKISAVQRIKGLLRRVASKGAEVAEKVAVEALSTYLQSLLKGAS
jgi:hypothetical protein